MSKKIQKVAVLGAGVMGSGIAAHLANAGIRSLLLDIVPPDIAQLESASSAERNRFALSARDLLVKTKPAPLFLPSLTSMIEVGNFEDDLGKIAECDWVIEVVKEELAVKQKLFAKVDQYRKSDTIITSNTSGLPLAGMVAGRSDSFRQHFMITHFFNPVRYMKLLELVVGPETLPEVVATIHRFGEEILGKGIVYAKDTTNFIANRIGTYGMMKAMGVMREMGLTIEEVDAVFGPAMGRPKSAIFGTADLVGLDTLGHVAKNCYDSLSHDEERSVFEAPPFLVQLIEQKRLGRKSGAGFYKKTKDAAGQDTILMLDPASMDYIPQTKPRFDSLGKARKAGTLQGKVKALFEGTDKAAQFAQIVTLHTLAYASRRIPEIANDIANIDAAMRWGFAWESGPFETWDMIGLQAGLDHMDRLNIPVADWVRTLAASGATSFYAVSGTQDTYWNIASSTHEPVPINPRTSKVDYLKRGERKITNNSGATLWDMGDGIVLLEFHTKMNAIDDDVIQMMHKAIDIAEADFRGIVIGNDGANFSAGANIFALLMGAKMKQFDRIGAMVTGFQNANQRMRYCSVPVVTAPFGLTLGGGAEVTMGGNATQAAAETYMGLVEVGVGLIPGGGGNLQLMRNVFGPYGADPDFDAMPFLTKLFKTIGLAKVATSADEAIEAGYLTKNSGVSLNRDFLLSDAKALCVGLANSGFRPPFPSTFRLPGRSGRATIDMMLYNMELNGQASAHDRKIGLALANVLCGGDTTPATAVTEERLLELEREAFLSLCGEEKTMERLAYMLESGKPLRN